MLKIFSNFIPIGDFLTGMNDTSGSNDFYRDGNNDLKYKSISLFNDHPGNEHQLSLNDINILMIMEPNQLFNLHNYAIQNYNQYSAILTWGQEILDNCPNAIFHPMGISWLDKEYVDNVDNREKRFEVSFLCGGKEKIEGIKPKFQKTAQNILDNNTYDYQIRNIYEKDVAKSVGEKRTPRSL